MHMYKHMCIYVERDIYMCICIYIYIYIHKYIERDVCMYVCVHVYIYIYKRVFMCLDISMPRLRPGLGRPELLRQQHQ